MKWSLGIFVCLFFNLTARQWESIPGNLRYDQGCYLTSHNSYAATDYGYLYAQQNLSIAKQLELGVRGLKLALSTEKDRLVLCHKSPALTRLLSRGKEPMLFQDSLTEISTFLADNPDEVLTIFLEMNVNTPPALVDRTLEQSGLEKYILNPEDCSTEHTVWPSLHWMRTHNKRLVLFNYKERTSFCFSKWHHVAENQWGTTHSVKACKERPQSQKHQTKQRSLYMLNYFPTIKFNYDNSYHSINTAGLESFLQRVLTRGLSSGSNYDLLPTFICIDFVDIGHGLEQISKINNIRLQASLENKVLT